MTKIFDSKRRHDREMIAYSVAKLMVEDAIEAFSKAKHKAARQQGVGDTYCLPSNMEVELALRGNIRRYINKKNNRLESRSYVGGQ